jgi:GntR family transcriptional regulator
VSAQQNDHRLVGQIDKTSPLPYHYQLREIIRNEIVANRWNGGDRLPSESELCDIFRVSRTTVREALDALVGEGLLTREKGLGTFVTEPKFMETWAGSTVGFSDSITKQGYSIETKVLELTRVPAQHHVRQELQLRDNDHVFLLRRLRFILNQPILVVHSYLPAKRFPDFLDIDFTNKSLYQTLRSEYGIQMERVKRTIEAIAADKDVAELLEVPLGFPVMFIENTAYTQDHTPIEYYLAWRRGDKARFQFEYSLPPGNP